jgi:hypothetical protein
VRPYAGVGALLLNESFDSPTTDNSETNVGYNLVWGSIFNPSARVQPFVHAQYTVIQDYPNHFTLTGGASFAIGGSSATRTPVPRSR